MASTKGVETQSTPATPDLTEAEARLLEKLEPPQEHSVFVPEPSLSLPETTGAGTGLSDDIITTIAKPSGNLDAADEIHLEKSPAIPARKLATEQMFDGLAKQFEKPRTIEQFEQSVDTLEQKVDAILNTPAGAEKPALIADQVSCSVFAPSQTAPSQSVMVQVFLHVDAELIKIREMALEADQGAERRLGTARLKTQIIRGAMIDIVLEGRGLEVDEKMQSLIWQGAAESVNFITTMPEGTTHKDYFPIARLFIDGIPIGHIKFKLSAIPEQATSPIGFMPPDGANHSTPQGLEERIYKRAFLSYSRKNFNKVSHFNEGLVHAGYQTFFDLESLNSGERWNDRIMQEIRECDAFYLFWTSESKSSKWVDQETRYAHDLFVSSGEKSPDIIPILLETPMPSPPDFISDLHFNSRHQLIRAGMSVS